MRCSAGCGIPEPLFRRDVHVRCRQVRGELSRVLDEIYLAWSSSSSRVWSWWQKANDALTARENVHHHYDLGNEFYRLWLDAELVYVRVFSDAGRDARRGANREDGSRLPQAPACARRESARGRMRLARFALFMAKHYGVTVRAFNISAEQMEYARRRAQDEGLADRVEFIEDDYRNVTGQYDAFVSIGMLEHVGLPDYPTLGRVIDRVLPSNGRGCCISSAATARRRSTPGSGNGFSRALIPDLREVFERVLETRRSRCSTWRTCGSITQTLEHWLRRFDDASEEVDRMFDQTFSRAWRLYLAGSRAAFVTGWMQLFQVVFARGGSNAIPWTRVSG